MPARTFNRSNIRWRKCDYCGNDFPDSRKNRRFCKREHGDSYRRSIKRQGAIAASGGRCKDCGRRYDADHPTPFYVLRDGTVVCGADLSRRSREKFWKHWPKGRKGYQKTKRTA